MSTRYSARVSAALIALHVGCIIGPALGATDVMVNAEMSWATKLSAASERGAPAELCRLAVQQAELRFHLPHGMLWAIAQVELARTMPEMRSPTAWPWTVQAQGKGQYFETKAKAIAWTQEAQAKGVTSIDTGCLQINLLSHPNAFRSLDEAFDPQRNADYAGRFLRELYAKTGDWHRTIGLYHSQALEFSIPYQEKISHVWSNGRSSLSCPFSTVGDA